MNTRIQRFQMALCTALAMTSLQRASLANCNATVKSTPFVSGLSIPVDLRNAGDDRLFAVELGGRIRIVANGNIVPTPFLDISSNVASGGERGLVSLAFHPSYPTTPWFFVYYTNNEPAVGAVGDIVIARYSVSANPNVADPASRKILLVIPHSNAANHNGGQLQFGPLDGYLYISVGDGGGLCDSSGSGCNAQRDDLLLGKILRIDVSPNTPPFYAIPPSNPFAAAGLPRDEIWAKGVRNPFRMSFDAANGNLWIADVGQDTREEIDFQATGAIPGRNYGWPVMEGTGCGPCNTDSCPAPVVACNAPSLTLPVHEYDHSVGNVIIGGYVYRGSRIPALGGCYLFADNGSAHVWAIDPAAPATRRTLDANLAGVTTFGQDRNLDLYMATGSGIIYRLEPAPAAVPAVPTRLIALATMGLLGLGAAGLRRRRNAASAVSP